jgi:hypothetical protein
VNVGGKYDVDYSWCVQSGKWIYSSPQGFKIAPINRRNTDEMIRVKNGYPTPERIRDEKVIDMDILANTIVEASNFVVENGDIGELDLNLVFCFTKALQS